MWYACECELHACDVLAWHMQVKLGRKGRDPAREIAEWNKLKGIAGKG